MISPAAKACPQCGAPVRRTKTIMWLIGGFVALVVGITIVQNFQQERVRAAAAQAEQKRLAAMTPEEKAAAAAAKKREAERKAVSDAAWSTAQSAAFSIKKSAHDPESVVFNEAAYTDAGTVVLEFRAKNAFGALIKQVAIVTKDGKMVVGAPTQDTVASAWNRLVAGITMYKLPTPRV